MMKPMKVSFYLYADDENQVRDLQNTLYDVVMDGFQKGRLVTAVHLNDMIRKYINNPLLTTLIYT